MKDKPATEYALLGALMPGPKHGYDIMQSLEAGLGPTWRVSTSQLYALLKRLDDLGFVASNLEAQDTRPSKRVFSIMPTGKRHFLEWLNQPTEHVRDLRIEFLAKLYFFHALGLRGGRALVETQITFLERIREDLSVRKQSEKNPYRQLVYGFRIATLAGWLDWLRGDATSFVNKES